MSGHHRVTAAGFRSAGALFDDVRRIAVLRPCALGDFVFALPALAALRAAYPDAELILLGRAWQAAFLAGRPGMPDEVCVMPPVPGVGAPDDSLADAAAEAAFVAALRQRGIDLAVQLYGGGGYSNPWLRRLGARHTVGMHAPGVPALERSLPYVYLQNERLRLLEVASLAGAPAVELEARLPLLPRDIDEADRLVAGPANAPLVVIQPGATDPRRRWAPQRFAAVADVLAGEGARIAVHGSPDEHALVQSVCDFMRHPAQNLAAAALTVSGLTGLLARATLLVSNDTGPLHLATALDTPSVGIYWFTNLQISAPLSMLRHRPLVSCCTRCPVCGQEGRGPRCGHDASLVDEVSVEAVTAEALALYREALASSASATVRTA